MAPLTKGEFKLRLRVIAVDTSHRSIAGLCRGAEILPMFCSTKCSWSLDAEMNEFRCINIGLNVCIIYTVFPRKVSAETRNSFLSLEIVENSNSFREN